MVRLYIILSRAVVREFAPDGAKRFTGFHRGSGTVCDGRRGEGVPAKT